MTTTTTQFLVESAGNVRQFTPAKGDAIVVSMWNGDALTIIVQNASHRAFKRMGRTFRADTLREQVAKARPFYKSANVQAVLDMLEQEVQQ